MRKNLALLHGTPVVRNASRFLRCVAGTGWERTPWHATQRAAWEALKKASYALVLQGVN